MALPTADLLAPIPGDAPAGADLRYAPAYAQITEARREEAAGLARKHGLYRTARTLPIDYVNLRKRFRSAAPVAPVPRLQFEELSPAPAGTGYCVELVWVQGNGAVDWSQLLRAWRQSER